MTANPFEDDPRDAVRRDEARLGEIIQRSRQRQKMIETELADLKTEYAKLLCDIEFGRSNDTARKLDLRTRIRVLEEDLALLKTVVKDVEAQRKESSETTTGK